MGQHVNPQTATLNELSFWEKERIKFTGSQSTRFKYKNNRSSIPVYGHKDMVIAVGDLLDGKSISPALPLPDLVGCLSELWTCEAQGRVTPRR